MVGNDDIVQCSEQMRMQVIGSSISDARLARFSINYERCVYTCVQKQRVHYLM